MARTAPVLKVAVCLLGGLGGLGCRASGTTPFQRPSDDDAGGVIVEAGASDAGLDAPDVAPHALRAVEPPHGPFQGGTLVQLRGNGFRSNARVWFGPNEVPASDVVPVSPRQIQVTAPRGDAGSADVVVQNGDDESTRVEIPAGFEYDAYYADPASGPTSGGTLVTIHGQGTPFDAGTEVSIDRGPCDVVEVRSETELVCRTPPGTQGSKTLRVTDSDGVSVDVLDAFTYGNSDNGFRGGLSGNSLDGELKVLVFDSITGQAVSGASVVVGSDEPTLVETDASGVALVQSAELGETATVTIAKHCLQPITFVDVPVDTVTVYLDPVLSATCFAPEGDLPVGGGVPGQSASVVGELVWPESAEFRREGWSNVPDPKSEDEVEVAYVFRLSPDPTDSFNLPSAVSAVTPLDEAGSGYRFNVSSSPGNYTLYALAGLENRAVSPPAFLAYAMGIVRGVAAPAGRTVEDVFIRIDVPLDHSIGLELEPPVPTRRGPNRVEASVAVRVGSEGYVLLPGGQHESLIGGSARLDFVGVPPLIGSLAGSSYVATARAATGAAGGLPRSVLGLVSGTTSGAALALGAFVEIPVLDDPPVNGVWNGQDLRWNAAPGGLAPSLVVIDVETTGGLYYWRVVAPGDAGAVRLPDLGALDARIAWPRGAQNIVVSRARVENFDYRNLRYRDLTPRGWTAHAMDASSATY